MTEKVIICVWNPESERAEPVLLSDGKLPTETSAIDLNSIEGALVDIINKMTEIPDAYASDKVDDADTAGDTITPGFTFTRIIIANTGEKEMVFQIGSGDDIYLPVGSSLDMEVSGTSLSYQAFEDTGEFIYILTGKENVT